MTIDITGITNENEFYTHHYLSAILENDLKDLFKSWKKREEEEEIPQPYITIRSLRKEFFSMVDDQQKESNTKNKLKIQRQFLEKLLLSLGYQYQYQLIELDEGASIPIIGSINKSDGSSELWIVEVLDTTEENLDPLELKFLEEQYPNNDETEKNINEILEEVISRHIFSLSEPPRWLLLINNTQLLLIDRSKWHEKRLLRFDIREILDRRETTTLQAIAALLHRDSICPSEGVPLLDTLDENSHKHAFSVSEDLKYSLRKAIELLGNEAVWYMKEKRHERLFGRDLAEQLTRECLRYMYRVLFLLYIEARPELGYLPEKSEEYRKGYSFESLRDLELTQLTTEESKNGFFTHESIKLLFSLLYDGFPKTKGAVTYDMESLGSDVHTFKISPLKSHLFDPKQTPILNGVKLRNFVMQEIIELMSLSRPKTGKKARRGRISYSQLGINQLGAVYEGLLSYQGFFADTDLFEVKKATEQHNVLDTAYFVKAEDLEQYTENERVFNDDGSLAKFEKGTFIYRLAGRDRENSASYYTPEVLTQCLVKYALKELLKEKTADEILKLTVCEPAMGSAAFLNEAVNQLSKAYLDKKQKELKRSISHEDYPKELQKVKMYLTDNNVYGVDLNPVAVELAEISLWLNSIHEGSFVPWFGMQLRCGNSLVGARRQVYHPSLLKKKNRNDPIWLDKVPKRVMPGEKRQDDSIYHFLLPDKSMADYGDKVIKKLAKTEIKKIDIWRSDFTKPFSTAEIELLKGFSKSVDRLWELHARQQTSIVEHSKDPLHVFGQKKIQKNSQPILTGEKDQYLKDQILPVNVMNSSPFQRLKLIMDYWCSLWYWPIEKAESLPSRSEYILEMTMLLEGELVNIDQLCKEHQRFGLVRKLADKYHFHHWELEFAHLFKSKGGFDLIVGNPPWIKVEWNEGGIMGDAEPLFVLRKLSASNLAEKRNEIIEKYDLKSDYLNSFEGANACKNFLNGYQNYPLLKGIQTNLFKCFLPQAWMIGGIETETKNKQVGVSAFLHPEGIYDDPKGGIFREEVYLRLKHHFQFQNELNLFADVDHHAKFSINIFGNKINDNSVEFKHLANLFTPSTIDNSFNHDGRGTIPGIKDDKNKWCVKGHRDRIIEVTENELSLFAEQYDEKGTPNLMARLPAIHSSQLIGVLQKFTNHSKRLGDLKSEYYSTQHWNETGAQKDCTIKRGTCFPSNTSDLILSGPHFYVSNPLYKSPRSICSLNSHYDILDLTYLSDDYFPRTNFVPDCDLSEYKIRSPKVPWGNNDSISEYYRFINREMIGSSAERTFVSTIIPKGPGHIHTCISICFKNPNNLLSFASLAASLPIDFLIKSTGSAHANMSMINRLPYLDWQNNSIAKNLMALQLSLVCLTRQYEELWKECWQDEFRSVRWAKKDRRLLDKHFELLEPKWQKCFSFQTDFERRQALVETDVLAAMTLKLTLDELKAIYRIQFPVMRQYEADTWYDKNGRITFTCSKGLIGVGFSRPEWNNIKDMNSGIVERTIIDDTLPGGSKERVITYKAPFDRCDRERDYDEVWKNFLKKFEQEKK
jgi:type I restriction-modification system DNA methylase subunit